MILSIRHSTALTNRGTPLGEAVKKKPVLVEPGSDKSAVIILLTDGATNAGPDPIEAARQAANHGVRVFTVGFGTASGDIVGFGGGRWRAQLDEESLKRIADITRAQYYKASSCRGAAGGLQAPEHERRSRRPKRTKSPLTSPRWRP